MLEVVRAESVPVTVAGEGAGVAIVLTPLRKESVEGGDSGGSTVIASGAAGRLSDLRVADPAVVGPNGQRASRP
jgi:hypothetical protein